jgi:hypothetical protein
MITKKDIRDWMIEHNVYGGNIEEIDNRLTHAQINRYIVRSISADFSDLEDNEVRKLENDFDRHFEDVGWHIYNELPDTNEPQLNYLDILEKL